MQRHNKQTVQVDDQSWTKDGCSNKKIVATFEGISRWRNFVWHKPFHFRCSNHPRNDEHIFETGSLYANTDSSYADEKDHGWSTMGQLLMTNGGLVHQKSYEYKAQMQELGVTLGESSVMTSIVQAEYVCLSNGAKECMAYSQLVDFFRDAVKEKVSYGLEGASKFAIKEESDMANGNEFEKHPSPLMCFGDNEGSIRITKKREMTKLVKRITIKHHHIRSCMNRDVLNQLTSTQRTK